MSALAIIWSRPNGRFLIRAAAFLGLFLMAYRDEFLGRLLEPLSLATAVTAAGAIEFFGMEVVRTLTVLRHPDGFAYEIYYRCTGLLPVVVFAIITLAYPAPSKPKAVGLGVGIPFLLFLNLARLVHLFYIGVHSPDLFDLAHSVLWEAILIGAAFLLFWRWSGRVSAQAR
jgi:exosortase/archaeosortase family protein